MSFHRVLCWLLGHARVNGRIGCTRCNATLEAERVVEDAPHMLMPSPPVLSDMLALSSVRRYGRDGRKARLFARGNVRIWSQEHGAYWRPGRCGYTRHPEEAGVYSFDDALASTDHCGPEKGIYYERDV